MENVKNTVNDEPKGSPQRRIERWEIWWILLSILGPAAFIGPFVALLFGFHAAAGGWFFLALAIVGIVLYALIVFLLLRTWVKAPRTSSGAKTYYSSNGSGSITTDDLDLGPKVNAGIIGMAMLHCLFGGNHKSSSDTAYDDLFWQEKYRNHD